MLIDWCDLSIRDWAHLHNNQGHFDVPARSSGTGHLTPTLKHKFHETDARSVIQERISWLEQGDKFLLWSYHRLVIHACARGPMIKVPVIRGTGPPQGQKHWKRQVGTSWKYYRDLVAFQHFSEVWH